jgi:hypothetical protein
LASHTVHGEPSSDETSSPKRRSASLEPHVSFNIATLATSKENVDDISSLDVDFESQPFRSRFDSKSLFLADISIL